MNTAKYRFYIIDENETNWYLRVVGPNGEYLTDDREEATLFSESEWKNWGIDSLYISEEICEYEKLRLAGTPPARNLRPYE